MFGLADDTDKTAVAHDCNKIGHCAGAILLQFRKLRARVLRPQHAAVQHSPQRLIVDESRPTQNLVGNVDPLNWIPGQCPARCDLWRYARCGVAIERNFLGKLPITGPDIARSRNGTVLDVERIDVDAQPFRRLLKKDPANFRAGMAQRAARLLDGEAA